MSLPEYLKGLTEDIIRLRMLEKVPSDVDKSEGSFIWDSLSPAAFELYGASLWAQEVLRRGFASTTFGEYLDLRCEERGVIRNPAVKATGQILITGNAGTTIPAGTRVATPSDEMTATSSVEFETAAAVTLDSQGKATTPITAVEAGANGNVPIGAISILVDANGGVIGVTNPVATTGGKEAESDEALLARYLFKVRQPGTSGNKADYLQWALEVPGVGGAQVDPLWNGPGTVRLFVLNTDKRAPDQATVDAVQTYISPVSGQGEGKAPIGANVTVTAAVEVPINISVEITLTGGSTLSDARDAFAAELIEYFKQLAFTDPIVRYSRIAALLLDTPSIIDYANLTVNGSGGNLDIQLGQVAVLGTVSVNV